ncbi:glycoside hydrolase family 28 protein [Vallitalea pronyensis]|uniref:Glycoside hydrolase family 28 protein n=1 Tax=Vallitalea pronyensis TaxID=1348613 RepID=A0A8J8MIL2_9FIRM|nr:glycosyl hydrolase family 28 protein [Vallitalea pronyensis]QUI22117.1 glycoside hydrolase family 28 protein [Vallitalea pronyensis]
MDINLKAKGNSVLRTKDIQQAIDACSHNGGGHIYFEAGVYPIGTIYLKSNVHLRLDNRTIIQGSASINDYTQDTHKQMYRNETHMDRCLIFAKDCKHISIVGGVFDGQGETFKGDRPMMFRYLGCEDIRIEEVKMINPASWTNAFIQCKHIRISHIDIHSRANKNGDGLDFDACENVFVHHSTFNCSDDCICVQNSSTSHACANIFIDHNVFESKWAGIRIGLLSTGVIEHVFVSNCSFKNIACSGLKIQSSEGALIHHIHCSHLSMDKVRRPFFITLNHYRENVNYADEPINTKSQLSRITVSDIYATTFDNNALPNCMIIDAEPGNTIEDIVLRNIHYTVYGNSTYEERQIPYLGHTRAEAYTYEGDLPASGLFARNVKGLHYEGIKINTKQKDCRKEIVQV